MNEAKRNELNIPSGYTSDLNAAPYGKLLVAWALGHGCCLVRRMNYRHDFERWGSHTNGRWSVKGWYHLNVHPHCWKLATDEDIEKFKV